MNIYSLAPLLGVGSRAAYNIVHAYERVYGRLPRYDREIRVPSEVVDRIREARELVKAGEVDSYEEAFRLFKGGGLILTPDDRERMYKALERLLEQAEALDPLLALVGYLREEVDILRSEIDQIRLVLYGGADGSDRPAGCRHSQAPAPAPAPPGHPGRSRSTVPGRGVYPGACGNIRGNTRRHPQALGLGSEVGALEKKDGERGEGKEQVTVWKPWTVYTVDSGLWKL